MSQNLYGTMHHTHIIMILAIKFQNRWWYGSIHFTGVILLICYIIWHYSRDVMCMAHINGGISVNFHLTQNKVCTTSKSFSKWIISLIIFNSVLRDWYYIKLISTKIYFQQQLPMEVQVKIICMFSTPFVVLPHA